MNLGSSARSEAAREFGGLFVAYEFLSDLFGEQRERQNIIEVEAELFAAILLKEGKQLSASDKADILRTVASVRKNCYLLERIKSTEPGESANLLCLIDFTTKLADFATTIESQDIEALRSAGLNVETILEVIQVAAVGQWLCTLAAVSYPEEFASSSSGMIEPERDLIESKERLYTPLLPLPLSTELPAFSRLRDEFGFVPSLFKIQAATKDALEAEINALGRILFLARFWKPLAWPTTSWTDC